MLSSLSEATLAMDLRLKPLGIQHTNLNMEQLRCLFPLKYIQSPRWHLEGEYVQGWSLVGQVWAWSLLFLSGCGLLYEYNHRLFFKFGGKIRSTFCLSLPSIFERISLNHCMNHLETSSILVIGFLQFAFHYCALMFSNTIWGELLMYF